MWEYIGVTSICKDVWGDATVWVEPWTRESWLDANGTHHTSTAYAYPICDLRRNDQLAKDTYDGQVPIYSICVAQVHISVVKYQLKNNVYIQYKSPQNYTSKLSPTSDYADSGYPISIVTALGLSAKRSLAFLK